MAKQQTLTPHDILVAALRAEIVQMDDDDHKAEVKRCQLVTKVRELGSKAGLAWELSVMTPVILEACAAHYGVALLDGQRKAKGRKVMDSGAEGYERARKAQQRLTDKLFPKTKTEGSAVKAKAEPATEYEIPADVAELAAKLVAACREYDVDAAEMKRWAAAAVATAFAAK